MNILYISLYENSEDPIATGYTSKSNLEFSLERVIEMYNNYKSKETSLIKKSAFILYNIISGHPFTDGNKRTAIILSNAFLEYNGFSIGKLSFRESKKFIIEVAKGNKTEKDCEKFIKKHIFELNISDDIKKKLKEICDRLNLQGRQ